MNQQIANTMEYIPNLNTHTDLAIGRGLQKARKMKNFSRFELAFRLSWSDEALEAYEQGDLPISASSLYTLCEVLDMSIDEFYDLAFAYDE